MNGSDRSGFYVRQSAGYSAFIPRALPPIPSLDLSQLVGSLSRADQALGRLDGATRNLPDVNLFLAMYVRQEALLSSQIEGTDCTLDDLLAFELDARTSEVPELDVQEVVNYVAALNYGMARLTDLPINRRLLCEIHARLLQTGRGSDRSPGEFRRTQNWIGSKLAAGSSIDTATFVPPPPNEMEAAFSELERYLDSSRDNAAALPLLVDCALAHAQFETIHPYLDGNGRMGRLLITLLLCERGVLTAPVLYLSTYLRRSRSKYFELLMEVRDHGTWEAWIDFFLRGIGETAAEAAQTAQKVHAMRETHRRALEMNGGTLNDLAVLDRLFSQPLVNAAWVERSIGVSQPTANAILSRFEASGVLREITGQRRNRVYRYDAYLTLFDQPVLEPSENETLS
jgi:Fic family protein